MSFVERLADMSQLNAVEKIVLAFVVGHIPFLFAGFATVYVGGSTWADFFYLIGWMIPVVHKWQTWVVVPMFFAGKYALKPMCYFSAAVMFASSLRFINYYWLRVPLGSVLPACQTDCGWAGVVKDSYQTHIIADNYEMDGISMFRADWKETSCLLCFFYIVEGLRRFSLQETAFFVLFSIPIGFDSTFPMFLLRLCEVEQDVKPKSIGKFFWVYVVASILIWTSWSTESIGLMFPFFATHRNYGLLGSHEKDYDMIGGGTVNMTGQRLVVPVMTLLLPVTGWFLPQVAVKGSNGWTWFMRTALFMCFLQNIAGSVALFLAYRELQPNHTLCDMWEKVGTMWPNRATASSASTKKKK